MTCQVEVAVVGEVDGCRFGAGCGIVDHELVLVIQLVRDGAFYFTRKSLLTVRTDTTQFHLVFLNGRIPYFL